MLLALCQDAAAWLAAHPSHVVLLHCKAGKGRTGLAICCLLLFLAHTGALPPAALPVDALSPQPAALPLAPTPPAAAAEHAPPPNVHAAQTGAQPAGAASLLEAAVLDSVTAASSSAFTAAGVTALVPGVLRLYDTQRTYDGKGLTIPSQRRYVHHFARLLECLASRLAGRMPMPARSNADNHARANPRDAPPGAAPMALRRIVLGGIAQPLAGRRLSLRVVDMCCQAAVSQADLARRSHGTLLRAPVVRLAAAVPLQRDSGNGSGGCLGGDGGGDVDQCGCGRVEVSWPDGSATVRFEPPLQVHGDVKIELVDAFVQPGVRRDVGSNTAYCKICGDGRLEVGDWYGIGEESAGVSQSLAVASSGAGMVPLPGQGNKSMHGEGAGLLHSWLNCEAVLGSIGTGAAGEWRLPHSELDRLNRRLKGQSDLYLQVEL